MIRNILRTSIASISVASSIIGTTIFCDSGHNYNYNESKVESFKKAEVQQVKHEEKKELKKLEQVKLEQKVKEKMDVKYKQNKNYSDAHKHLFDSGVRNVNLIFALDVTGSSQELHNPTNQNNPYKDVIQIMTDTFEPFDDKNNILAIAFGYGVYYVHGGENKKRDMAPITNINPSGGLTNGFDDVMIQYNKFIPHVSFGGDSCFRSSIESAIAKCISEDNSYNILIIVSDGGISQQTTSEALARASKYPISIIAIIVGDEKNQFQVMDCNNTENIIKNIESTPNRVFDNFGFVNHLKISHESKSYDKKVKKIGEEIAKISARQYKDMIKNGILKFTKNKSEKIESDDMFSDENLRKFLIGEESFEDCEHIKGQTVNGIVSYNI
jgi:hypothetical protein